MIQGLKVVFCTYFKNIEKFRYKSETYGEYVAFCLMKGSFRYSIGDGEERISAAPDAVICPPKTAFKRETAEPCELCMIKFTCTEPFELSLPFSFDVTRFIYNMERLKDCVFCSDNLTETHRHFCNDTVYMLCEESTRVSAVDCAISYINENCTKNLSISELAAASGFSETHFINLFKKQTGDTPKNYLIKARLRLAKQILCSSDKRIGEIVEDCGFSDEYYFSRLFKKYEGQTPSAFRRQNG